MRRTLHVDPGDAAPIWRQIEEGMRHLVASRALRPGAPVPSVRELSRELRVNPATVAKAYQRRAGDGVLTVRRGEGTFVSQSPPVLAEEEQRRTLRHGAERYASLAMTIGAEKKQAVTELKSAWSAIDPAAEGAEDE